jgi:alanine dehydrogenase
MAHGMQADVTILDRSVAGCAELDAHFRGARRDLLWRPPRRSSASGAEADLVIGAVLVPGAAAPKLVTEEMVRRMVPARRWSTSPSTRAAASRPAGRRPMRRRPTC